MGFLAILAIIVALIYAAAQFTFMLASGLFILFLVTLVSTVYASVGAALGMTFLLNYMFPSLNGWLISLLALLTGFITMAAIAEAVTNEVKKKYNILKK